jgi:hypothetical protein
LSCAALELYYMLNLLTHLQRSFDRQIGILS